jgi:hypothetical protein
MKHIYTHKQKRRASNRFSIGKTRELFVTLAASLASSRRQVQITTGLHRESSGLKEPPPPHSKQVVAAAAAPVLSPTCGGREGTDQARSSPLLFRPATSPVPEPDGASRAPGNKNVWAATAHATPDHGSEWIPSSSTASQWARSSRALEAWRGQDGDAPAQGNSVYAAYVEVGAVRGWRRRVSAKRCGMEIVANSSF